MLSLKKFLLLGSLGWGGGMFLFVLVTYEWKQRPMLLVILLFLFLVGGALWGVAMHYFMRVVVPALQRYAGVKNQLPATATSVRSPWLARLAPSILSASPVLLAALWRSDLIWPAIGASVGPIIVLLPLASRSRSKAEIGMRIVIAFSVGLFTAIVIATIAKDSATINVPMGDVFACAVFSGLWTCSQAFAIWRYKRLVTRTLVAQPPSVM